MYEVVVKYNILYSYVDDLFVRRLLLLSRSKTTHIIIADSIINAGSIVSISLLSFSLLLFVCSKDFWRSEVFYNEDT